MIDAGINYFDVQWEPEEYAIAEVIKTRREEMIIAWPLHGVTQQGGNLTAQYVVDYCNDHRQRFGVEHVEILLWVGLELNPETQEAAMDALREGFESLRAGGFCDHLAFSCHHSPEMAMRAIESFDDFAVLMVPYCRFLPRSGEQLFTLARSRNIGVVAMKPFGGADSALNQVFAGTSRVSQLDRYTRNPRPYEAALRWVLSNPDVDCTVPGFSSVEEIDTAVAASLVSFGPSDEAVLNEIERFMDYVQIFGNRRDLLFRFQIGRAHV